MINENCIYEVTNLASVKERIDYSKPVMFDSETIGLYGKIRLVQFFQADWDCALLVEYPNAYELAEMLSKAILVCHNAHYDITCIQVALGKQVWMPDTFHDTFFMARLHFYAAESNSLDSVIKNIIGHNPYDGCDHQKSDWSIPVLAAEQLEYAAKDVVYLQIVWNALQEVLEDINYKLDIITLRNCLDFQNNGVPLDINRLNEMFVKNEKRIKEINLPINCNSPKQVRPYINSTESADLGLAKLSYLGNEKAKMVRETRKLTKQNSFLTKFVNTMDDGCIFGRFKLGARSGRLTSEGQNLHQLPRATKGLFGVEDHGDTVIIFSDFAQIQLRCVCIKTCDTAMETLFRLGKDLHNYVAELTFGPDFTPEHRQIAKTENFGLLFGAGIVVFGAELLRKAGIYLSEAELMKLKKAWLNTWKQIAQWQTKGIKDWKNKVVWQTPLGRKYVAKMMTDQLAMQIQGFEAEVAKLAMHYMLPKLKALHSSIKLRNFIHDSFMFTCINDEEVYKEACKIIAEAMQEAWFEMGKNEAISDLPMPVKVQVGFNWGDMEKSDGKDGKVIYELKI